MGNFDTRATLRPGVLGSFAVQERRKWETGKGGEAKGWGSGHLHV